MHTRQSVGGEIFHDTYGAEGGVPALVAATLIEHLSAISLTLCIDSATNVIMVDGARYGVEVRDARYRFRVSWDVAPPQWRPLRDWYADAVATFESHLASPSMPLTLHHPWVE